MEESKPKRGPKFKSAEELAERVQIYVAKKHIDKVGGMSKAQDIAKKAIEKHKPVKPPQQ